MNASITEHGTTPLQSGGRPVAAGRAFAARFRPECAQCRVRELCVPGAMPADQVRLLDFVVVARRPVHRGQTIYRAGDPFEAIYPVRAGFFKTTIVSRDGNEHVTALRMPGDVLGLDGIATHRHSSDAVALDHGEVCVIPYVNMLEQALHNEALQRAFCAMVGRELVRDQAMLVLLGGMWGVERVAAFLIDFSKRLQAHGYSPSDFQLRMTRREIGSYLGMELETVSRIFSRLEREGLILADRGHVTITNPVGLARLAGQQA